VLSGRYKSQLVEGSGTGYFRTACDYVHLTRAALSTRGAQKQIPAMRRVNCFL